MEKEETSIDLNNYIRENKDKERKEFRNKNDRNNF